MKENPIFSSPFKERICPVVGKIILRLYGTALDGLHYLFSVPLKFGGVRRKRDVSIAGLRSFLFFD